MMQLFRSLADSGKTVVCITHNLFHVDDNAHRVVVLTAGGRLAFFGSPSEAKSYFQASKLSHIYTILPSKSADEWARLFKSSDAYRRYVASRMPHIFKADRVR